MVYRCKVCGGELNPKDGQTVVKCEYCGNINAIPKNADEDFTIGTTYLEAVEYFEKNGFDDFNLTLTAKI